MFSATKKDFRIDWFSGTGAGGQHRNKHQNCCRITHIPTGLTETGQEFRERSRNRAAAFKRLAHRLIALHSVSESRDRYASTERVRTYHEPRNIVTDHRSGETRTYKDTVIKNDLGPLISARRLHPITD